MFHVEHERDFMLGLAVLDESALGDKCQNPCGDRHPGLFDHLAGKGCRGGFSGLDVAAGEVAVATFEIAAQQDVPAAENRTACKSLDILDVSKEIMAG